MTYRPPGHTIVETLRWTWNVLAWIGLWFVGGLILEIVR